MTTHNRDKVIAAAKEAGFSVIPVTGSIYLIDGYKEAICTLGVSKLYAIAFEAGRQSVDTPVALAEAYRCGEEAGRQAEREDAERYRFLRDNSAYVGVNPHSKTCLWVLRGIREIDGAGFDEAVDGAIRARGDTK